MTPRPVEGFEEVTLGRFRGIRSALVQNKAAFDAQQLGHAPACFGALGSRQGLLDRNEARSTCPAGPKASANVPRDPK